MHRFFFTPDGPLAPGDLVFLPEQIAHQVRDVLHIALGEQLILLDNSGDELLGHVTKSSRGEVTVEIEQRHAGKSESPVRIILCQGLLKSARFEWVLEKGTELGVFTFVPTLCRRSMAGLEDAGPGKIQRWQRIIQEATEVSGRARRPELLPIRPLMHVLTDIPEGALAIMAWEEAVEPDLHTVLHNAIADPPLPQTVVLFIGPEGGLEADEVELARRRGVQIVTLGSRIMRAETAALAAVASIMYELEASR